MKRIITLLLCLALALGSLFAAGGCDNNDSSTDSPSSSDTGSVSDTGSGSVDPNKVSVINVTAPDSIVAYQSNIEAKPGHEDNEFFVRDKGYLVGTDNAFQFKPVVMFMDEDGELVNTPEGWTFSASVYLLEDEQATLLEGDELTKYLHSYDNVNCLFDFEEAAAGKNFRLSVHPDGLSAAQESRIDDYTASFDFSVVSGYNVYEAKDLSVISNYAEHISENRVDDNTATQQNAWVKFREDHGVTVNPDDVEAVILQNDITFTANDFPSEHLYSHGEAASMGKPYLEGSLKDNVHAGIFYRNLTEGHSFSIRGNYFTLDLSKLPYVKEMHTNYSTTYTEDENGNVVDSNVISHASFIRINGLTGTEEQFNISDLNVKGNSPKVTDKKVFGGVIFFKAEGNVTAENIISSDLFITAMAQTAKTSALFKDIKMFNAFNSPIYNWACPDLTLQNCVVKGAGGPAIIADAADNGGFINPRIVATDCVFDNPCTGDEAWFVMAGANSILSQVVTIGQDLSTALMEKYSTERSFFKQNGNRYEFNVYCVVKDDGDDVRAAGKYMPYIEINGAVMDFGYNTKDPYMGAHAMMLNGTITQAAVGNNQHPPVLETTGEGVDRKGGGLVYVSGVGEDGKYLFSSPWSSMLEMYSFNQQSAEQLFFGGMTTGSAANLYYYTGTGFGLLGVMFEYYN